MNRTKVANFLLYQVTWIACVVLAAQARPTAAAAVTFTAVLAHLALAERTWTELRLVGAAGVIGWIVDSFHVAQGFYTFEAARVGELCPPWIVAMWMLFAITLRSSMRWATRSYVVAAFVGLVGGPLAFVAGERIGAVAFADPPALALAALGVAWALSLPLLAWLAKGEVEDLAYRPIDEPAARG